MKKSTIRNLLQNRRINHIAEFDDPSQTLKSLEYAWSNMPEDITEDERYMFFELIEDVVKLHNRLDITFKTSDAEKN